MKQVSRYIGEGIEANGLRNYSAVSSDTVAGHNKKDFIKDPEEAERTGRALFQGYVSIRPARKYGE